MGCTSQTFLPLAVANPIEFDDIVARAENEVKALMKNGTLPPGLCEQYDIQLENLKDSSLPDHQVLLMPGVYPRPSPCSLLRI